MQSPRGGVFGDPPKADMHGAGIAVPFGMPHTACHLSAVTRCQCVNAWCHPRGCQTQACGSNSVSRMGCHIGWPTSLASCLHKLWVPHSVPTVLSSTILNEDSSRNHWGPSGTHTDLCHMLRTHICALFCMCISAHTRCHRHTEEEH